MTTKLYWDEARITAFTARVVASSVSPHETRLVLDRTAFYPLGGGQPGDKGTIAAVAVHDVASQEDGTIVHHLAAALDFTPGQEVHCQVDTAHRREMTQQHTGQHILSQTFRQLYGAETRGFRITTQAAEIDLTLDLPAAEIDQAIAQVEDFSNRIVFENRKVRTHLVTPAEAAAMPLRKESFITDCVRVVEIADFDWSACGGTHALQTGEVGLIAVRGWERAKQMTRVEFICGQRALYDYRLAHRASDAIARKFSVHRNDALDAVNRLYEEHKKQGHRIRQLAELAAKAEADALLENTVAVPGLRVVARVFDDRSLAELKLLAHQLVKVDAVIALLAVREATTARLVFARAANVPAEMGALMREACARLGGKGGGAPDFAQGGVGNGEELEAVLRTIAEKFA